MNRHEQISDRYGAAGTVPLVQAFLYLCDEESCTLIRPRSHRRASQRLAPTPAHRRGVPENSPPLRGGKRNWHRGSGHPLSPANTSRTCGSASGSSLSWARPGAVRFKSSFAAGAAPLDRFPFRLHRLQVVKRTLTPKLSIMLGVPTNQPPVGTAATPPRFRLVRLARFCLAEQMPKARIEIASGVRIRRRQV